MRKIQATEQSLEFSTIEIYMAEQGMLRRIVAGMGLNATDAEDVLQDVSIRILKHAVKFATRQQAINWMIRVTVNQCLAEYRRRKRFNKHANEILKRTTSNQPDPAEKNVIAAEELEIIRQSLRKLDNKLLGPIVLRYFCDMDSKEISKILQQNQSTIRSRLRVTRMMLAEKLLERGVKR